MESLNILSNIKGKYFYKSIRFIVFWVILPVILISTYLFIYHYPKVIQFFEIITS
jgi:hypothetical protein